MKIHVLERQSRLTGERAQQLAQAGALLGELFEATGELGRHVVELVSECRKLVAALNGNRFGEVTACKPPGRVQEAPKLSLKPARGQQRERQGERQEPRDERRSQHLSRGLRGRRRGE